MNLLQIEEGLVNGSIVIDYKGHEFNPVLDDISRYIKDKTEWIKELETGSYIGHDKKVWNKEECDDMIKFLNSYLIRNYDFGNYIFDINFYCFNCGLTHHMILVDEHTVSFIDYSTYDDVREIIKDNVSSHIPDCSVKSYCEDKKLVSEIDVPTGELLFVNHFNNDDIYSLPEKEEYRAENSLNCIGGRFNLMKYLSTKNIGYGQMGNMSVSVFLSDSGDEIIIGDDYGYNEEDEEYEIEHKGFKNLGSISLSVWRWMCGDLKVLREHKEEVPSNLVMNGHINKDYKDYVLANVKLGRWIIEHYFDFCGRGDIIYSKLYLKK